MQLKPNYYMVWEDDGEILFEEFDSKEKANKFLSRFNTERIEWYKVMSGFMIKEWTCEN